MMARGRPSKLTDEVQARICEGIRLGMTYRRAAERGRIEYATFRNWMKRGQAAKSGQFFDFFSAVKEAEADCTHTSLAIIRKAAIDGNWTAAAWLLERRYPDEYGRIARAPVESAKEPKDPPKPQDMIDSIRAIYGLPPKNAAEQKGTNGGNGASH